MKKEVQIVVSGKDMASSSIRKIGDTAEQAKREVLDMGKVLKGAVSVGLGIAGYQGVSSIFRDAKETVIGFNAEIEQTHIGFTTMLGSAREANKLIKETMTLSPDTPFDLDVIKDATVKMKAFGWETERLLPDIEDIGNAVAALGGSTDIFERVILAIGQMRTKGKVEAQELRQLAEAGIPAYEILAEKLGLTNEQISNIGKYSIESKVAIEALLEGFSERFPDMMKKQSDSYKGMISTIKDNTSIILGQSFKGTFEFTKDITRSVRDFTNMVRRDLVDGAQGAIDDAEKLAESYGRQVVQLDDLIGEYDILNGKTNKSKEEHDHLREVIDKIIEIAPQAVTGYDDMGNALLGNASAAKRVRDELWQLRKEQLEIATSRAKFEIPGLEEQIKTLEPLRKELESQLEKIAPQFFATREWYSKLTTASTDQERDNVIQEAIEAGVLKNSSVSFLGKQYATQEQLYTELYDKFISTSEALAKAKGELFDLKKAEAELAELLNMKPEEVKGKGKVNGGGGTGNKDVEDIIDRLTKSLAMAAQQEQLLGDMFDEDAAKISAYKRAFEEMLAVDPNNDKIKEWVSSYIELSNAQEMTANVEKELSKATQELAVWQNKDKTSALVLAESLREMAKTAGDNKDEILKFVASLEELDKKIKATKDEAEQKVKTDSLLEQAQSNINNWVNRNIDSYEILAKQLTEQAELDKTNANELMKLADALRRVSDEQKKLNDLQKLYDQETQYNEQLADNLAQLLTGGDLTSIFEDYGKQAAKDFSQTFIDEIRKITLDKEKLNLSISIDTSIEKIIEAIGAGLEEIGKDFLKTVSLGAQVGGGGTGASVGSTIGGTIGSIWGPIGTAVGSLAGGLFGGLFDNNGKPSKNITNGLQNLKDELAEFNAGGEKYYKNWWAKLWSNSSRDIEKTLSDLGQIFGTSVDDISSALESAFSADTYEEFVAGFSESIEEMTKGALIKAFMVQQLYPEIEKLYEEITKAAVDGTITPEERAKIIALQTGITEQSEDFYNTLKDLGIATGDVTDKMRSLSDSMQNLPQGFKVEQYRYSAINLGPSQSSNEISNMVFRAVEAANSAIRSPSITIEHMEVRANNPDEFRQEMSRENLARYGREEAPTYRYVVGGG